MTRIVAVEALAGPWRPSAGGLERPAWGDAAAHVWNAGEEWRGTCRPPDGSVGICIEGSADCERVRLLTDKVLVALGWSLVDGAA